MARSSGITVILLLLLVWQISARHGGWDLSNDWEQFAGDAGGGGNAEANNDTEDTQRETDAISDILDAPAEKLSATVEDAEESSGPSSAISDEEDWDLFDQEMTSDDPYWFPMTAEEGWEHAATVVERIVTPTFPDVDIDIVQYGAVGDGFTDCTEAFRNAIEYCHSIGGGRVVVPAGGVYLTGAIVLLSNVNLHVSDGATIQFTPDKSAYLPLVRSRYEGVELMNYSPLIYAYQQSNIAITGGGTLDGSANEVVWWDWKLGPMFDDQGPEFDDKDILIRMMEEGVPVEQRQFGEGYHIRPNFIVPFRCRNVLIEDVKIVNSPMWTIHPTFCNNVVIRGITVDSPNGPNNDGCVVDSSRNVLIEDSFFNTGDDCVAVKSGRGDDGRRVGIPSGNIVVRRCTMHAGHGGFVAGSEIAGRVYNIYSEDCDWNSPELTYGLRIKSNRRWGGFAQNVFVRNVRIQQVEKAAVRINFKYQKVLEGPHTPQVNNIYVQGVTSQQSKFALKLEGLEGAWVKNIIISDSSFMNVEKESVVEYVDNLVLKNVRFGYVPN